MESVKALRCIGLILVLSFAFFSRNSKAASFKTKPGEIDLNGFNIAKDKPAELRGEWLFYYQQELDKPKAIQENANYIKVPGFWNQIEDKNSKKPFPKAHTYSSYIIKIKNLSYEANKIYAIENDKIFSSYKLIILNDSRIIKTHQRGLFSVNEDQYIPSTTKEIIKFIIPSNSPESENKTELTLVYKIANYDDGVAGFFSAPKLSTYDRLSSSIKAETYKNLALIGVIAIMALYHFGLFSLRKTDFSSLFFAILCAILALRTFTTSGLIEFYFNEVSPWVYGTKMRLEFLTLYTSTLFFHLFLLAAFSARILKKLKKLHMFLSAAFSLTLLAPVKLFVVLIPFYQLWVLIPVLAAIYSLIIDFKTKKPGTGISLLGFVIFAVSVANDILHQQRVIDSAYIVQFGLLCFIFAQSYMLSYKFALTYKQVELQGIELTQKNIQLKEQEAARTLFFHNTSHELRTPLNGIIGFSELLLLGKNTNLKPNEKEKISKIKDLATSLTQQVNTILDLAKSKKGQLEQKNTCINLASILTETKLLSEGLALKKPLINFSIESSWNNEEKAEFIGDHDKIITIIRNLLGNAFKFTDNLDGNFVKLEFKLDKEFLFIAVKDSGIGIPKDQQEIIFEEFKQVEARADRKYEGTGLGLAMVKDFCKLMGAELSLDSELNKGSVFSLKIPEGSEITLVSEEKPLEPAYIEETTYSDSQQIEKEELSHLAKDHSQYSEENQNFKILVVDDNETNVEVISELLEIQNYTVIRSYGGKEGLEKFKSEKPDLVLLDLMMPEVSGEDVLKTAKDDQQLKETPVILVTARASLDDMIFGLELGADDYLSKPIIARELSLRVKNLVERIEGIRLKTSFDEVVKAEKNSTLGTMVAGVAHEINNPLGAIMSMNNNQKFLLNKEASIDGNLKDKLMLMVNREISAGKRIQSIIKGLLQYSKPDDENPCKENIKALLENVLSVTESQIKPLKFKISGDSKLRAEVFLLRVSHIISNFVLNAAYECRDMEAPKLEINFRAEKESLIFECLDSGNGISEEIIDKIYDPFFTTKDVGNGTGLGLAVSQRLAEEMNADINYFRRENLTVFELRLNDIKTFDTVGGL